MTGAIDEGPRAFSCRDVGYACEWSLRAASADEVQSRFRDHARCAHGLPEVSGELAARVAAAIRPA